MSVGFWPVVFDAQVEPPRKREANERRHRIADVQSAVHTGASQPTVNNVDRPAKCSNSHEVMSVHLK